MRYSIYRALNTVNGKSYVGYTSRCPSKRLMEHFTAARCGSRYYFHSAIRKYGRPAWRLVVLASTDNVKAAKQLETSFIFCLKTADGSRGYNRTPGGEGVCEVSLETRAKMSAAHRGRIRSQETRRRIAEARIGTLHSDAAKQKIRLANLGKRRDAVAVAKTAAGNRGKKRSAETRLKMRNAQLGMKRSPESVRKHADAIRGRKDSEETRKRKSAASLGRHPTEAVRAVLREVCARRKRGPDGVFVCA